MGSLLETYYESVSPREIHSKERSELGIVTIPVSQLEPGYFLECWEVAHPDVTYKKIYEVSWANPYGERIYRINVEGQILYMNGSSTCNISIRKTLSPFY